MPRGDRTGPAGMGPMTGRGMGYCSGYSAPGSVNAGVGYGRGRGLGLGRGFGGGFRRGPPAPGFGLGRGGLPRSLESAGYPLTEQDELSVLKEQEKSLEAQLKDVKGRLNN